jgi:hypothetical protein
VAELSQEVKDLLKKAGDEVHRHNHAPEASSACAQLMGVEALCHALAEICQQVYNVYDTLDDIKRLMADQNGEAGR